MFRKKPYLVALARLGENQSVETKPVYVEARSAGKASLKAILETPGLWSVVGVKKVKRV